MFALFSRNPIAKITITEIVNFTGAILALKFKVLVWTWVTNFCNLRAKIQIVIVKKNLKVPKIFRDFSAKIVTVFTKRKDLRLFFLLAQRSAKGKHTVPLHPG